MGSESLVEDVDARTAIKLLELTGTELDDAGNGDLSLGQRIGAAVGASLGRNIGETLGKRLIDELLLGADETDDTDSDEEANETEEEEPQRVDDLEELSYRDLQSLAKDVDVKANLPRDEMTEEIAKTLDLEE